jgi:hypothetical protein
LRSVICDAGTGGSLERVGRQRQQQSGAGGRRLVAAAAVAWATLLLLPTACVRPASSRDIMWDAHDLPCLAEDVVRPIGVDEVSPLGFTPRAVQQGLSTRVAPPLRRLDTLWPFLERSSLFLPSARLDDIRIEEDSWEIVERPSYMFDEGSRGVDPRFGPNGGPRPDYTCNVGTLVRGWGEATVVFDHEELGELRWDVKGWVESPNGDPGDLVFLFADWRRYFWRMPGRWRNALKDELGRGDNCPTQAQAVVEGQLAWGGWMSVHVTFEDCPFGGDTQTHPVIDLRWFDVDYESETTP